AQSELAASLAQARKRLADFGGGTERARAEDPSGRVESVPVPRPMPKPKPRVLSLAGRSGNGEWVTSRGTTYFTYEFQAGGRVVYRSNRETLTGSWTQNGNSVTVQVGQSSEAG